MSHDQKTPGQRRPILIFARTRASAAPRPAVALLAKIAREIDVLKDDFSDPIDKAALREARQLLHDVALSHDEAGNYGVYAIEQLASELVREEAEW